MSRLTIGFSIIAALGVFFISSTILARPAQIPHENPAMAKRSSDMTTVLLLSYGNALNLANTGQYQDAQDMLNELKHIDMPDELRYIADRYHVISQRLIATLDNLESLLDEAAILLDRNQPDDAREKLNRAEVLCADARFLLEDVEKASDNLGDILGVLGAATTSQPGQAYDKLVASRRQMKLLVDEFTQLRETLSEKKEIQAVKLSPTELSLSIVPTAVFVGNSVAVSGRLDSGSGSLSGRRLTITLADEPISFIITGADGSYAASLSMPYRYIPDMSLTVEYIPSGEDINAYQGCRSQPVPVVFHHTGLEVSAPETVCPGLPFTINGRISPPEDGDNRLIKVFLDNIQLAEAAVPAQFSLEVTPPQEILDGEHQLIVEVVSRGRCSGDVKDMIVNVSRLPIQVDLQAPQLVIMPNSFQVSGRVYHELGPVRDAKIALDFGRFSTVAETDHDGSFTVTVQPSRFSLVTAASSNFFYAAYNTIELPVNFSLVGPQELAVNVEIVEPWPASLEITERIFGINPLNTGLMLMVLAFLGLVMYRRGRVRQLAASVIVQSQAGERSVATLMPEPGPKLSGIRGSIMLAYTVAVEAIEKKTGITMLPQATLREFLGDVSPLVPSSIANLFRELTTIAEVALYSASKLDGDMTARAEHLAAAIKEELQSGAS
jgi:hypothetical protein